MAALRGRLVVLRTFSKVFGLAGLRVGYGLSDERLAERLRALKPPYNVNVAGQAAARAALDWYLVGARLHPRCGDRTRTVAQMAC